MTEPRTEAGRSLLLAVTPQGYVPDSAIAIGIAEVVRHAIPRIEAEAATPPAHSITHGRHCPCSACGRQDWADPALAPCGMHGPSCPPVYTPGVAATPPALDRETREYLHDMATRHSVFDPSDGNYRVETGTWNVILRALSTGDET